MSVSIARGSRASASVSAARNLMEGFGSCNKLKTAGGNGPARRECLVERAAAGL